MDDPMDFASILNGLQHMSERDKIILFSLMDRQRQPQAGEAAKIERYIGQMVIDAAREKRRSAQGGKDETGSGLPVGESTVELRLRSNRTEGETTTTRVVTAVPKQQPAAPAPVPEENPAPVAAEAVEDPPFKRSRRSQSLVTYLSNIWQPAEIQPSSPFLKNT